VRSSQAVRYALLALVVFAPSRALALDPELGARGQVVITDNLSANVSWQHYDASGAQFVNVGISPSLDYFVARNVSIGVDANVSYFDTHAYTATSAFFHTMGTSERIGLRVGVNVPLSRWLSIWPRATAYFESQQNTSFDAFLDSETSTLGLIDLTFFAPLVMHLRSHVFGAASGALLESVRRGDEMAFDVVSDALVVYDGGSFRALLIAIDEEQLGPSRP